MSNSYNAKRTRLYRSWDNMCQRYLNRPAYHERGIYTAWFNWNKFASYASKLEHAGEKGYTLDRINNLEGYYPGNIKFSTAEEQANNRKNVILYEINGEKLSIAQISRKYNIKAKKLYSERQNGTEMQEYINNFINRKDNR